MATQEKRTCCESVGNYYNTHPCGNLAKVERNGKWYCGTHDPVAIDARRKNRRAESDILCEPGRLRHKISIAMVKLADAVELANRAGGIVVGKLGTATVTREELFSA